jgi:hypothetical protein
VAGLAYNDDVEIGMYLTDPIIAVAGETPDGLLSPGDDVCSTNGLQLVNIVSKDVRNKKRKQRTDGIVIAIGCRIT